MTRHLTLVWLALVLASGCRLDDGGVAAELTIRVQSQGDVEGLSFQLFAVSPGGNRMIGNEAVGRSAAQLAAEPHEIIFTPLAPAAYVLHLVASSPTGETYVATRCYTLTGSLTDEVLLAGPIDVLDGDGDTFLSDHTVACVEPGPRSCTAEDYRCDSAAVSDCNDGDGSIHPGAPFICENGIDEDCDGEDEECGDNDDDGFAACGGGAGGPCDCDDNDATINPSAAEVCLDGIDQDCNGMDACCDADGDGFSQCGDGSGDCVDSTADCPPTFPDCDPVTVNPDALEICDMLDNNCNAQIDELDDCRDPDIDGDGVATCGREEPGAECEDAAFDCDPGIFPGARERCGNMIDEDLDGMVDETGACPAGDMDNDGQVAPRDCDDTDPLAYTHAAGEDVIDRCEDGVAQSCVPGEDQSCAGDRDGDGFIEPARCEDNAMVNPDVAEVCNGIDDNCDGVTDEILDIAMAIGCGGGMPITFASDFGHCGACRNLCDPVVSDQCMDGTCDCAGETGSTGVCTGTDPICCTDGCADLDSDAANCGACGVACGQGESCAGGICRCGMLSGLGPGDQACPEPTGATGGEASVCCGTSCRDIRSGMNNCGGCGITCGSSSALCDDRVCRCDPGNPNREDCNGDLGRGGDGCETDTQTSTSHCGACGDACNPVNATGGCTGGTCRISSCDSGFDDCDGVAGNGCEGDLRSLAHCGSCGSGCSIPNASETCSSGSCRVSSCASGWGDCDSDGTSCETPLDQLSHCGGCGVTCSIPNATATCSTRSCRVAMCDMGFADCDMDGTSCETPLGTATDCLSCGDVCAGALPICCAGGCSATACP